MREAHRRFWPPVMTTKEAAEYLGVSRRTLMRMLRRRAVPAFMPSGQWRFRRVELDVFIERRSVGLRTISPAADPPLPPLPSSPGAAAGDLLQRRYGGRSRV